MKGLVTRLLASSVYHREFHQNSPIAIIMLRGHHATYVFFPQLNWIQVNGYKYLEYDLENPSFNFSINKVSKDVFAGFITADLLFRFIFTNPLTLENVMYQQM